MKSLSIVIPVYNESDKIVGNLKECLRVCKSFKMPFELIVVDDGSTDGTGKLIRAFAKKRFNVKSISYKRNKGKGHALRYALKFVKNDLVAFIDADLELHPSQLKDFMKIMKREKCDVVVGSKRHPDSKLDYPWHRKFLSNGFYLLNKVLFGLPLKDTQSGIKLFKKKVLDNVFPRIVVKGYAFDLEVLVVANKFGYKIVEAPIELNFFRFESRVGFKSIKNIFQDTAGIFYRLYIIKYYDRCLK